MAKPKLLWVSDNPYLNFVGQSIVGRQVMDRLSDKYQIFVHGYTEVKHKQHHVGYELPYPVFTAERLDDDALKRTVARVKPDVLLFSHDTFLFGCAEELRKENPSMRIVGWMTIDGDPLPMAYRLVLSYLDCIISPTHWGKKVIKDQFYDLPVHVVPYGIDHKIWQPRADRAKLIEELREEKLEFSPYLTEKISKPETFVGIFWGHNQGKKNVGGIINSWLDADLPEQSTHLLMLLHSRKQKYGKLEYLADYDYRQKSLSNLTKMTVLEGSYQDATMAKFVQLANTLIFPSIGEGFGMPVLEGMAAGLVPITTNYAGVTDFCKMDQNALLVGGELVFGELGVRRLMVNHNHLAKTIKTAHKLHSEPDLKVPVVTGGQPSEYPSWNELSANAVETAKSYSWDRTAQEIDDILQQILKPDFQVAYAHSTI